MLKVRLLAVSSYIRLTYIHSVSNRDTDIEGGAFIADSNVMLNNKTLITIRDLTRFNHQSRSNRTMKQ